MSPGTCPADGPSFAVGADTLNAKVACWCGCVKAIFHDFLLIILFSCQAVRPWLHPMRLCASLLDGVVGVFGGVVTSVRDWRVSGDGDVWVGRLLATETNCRPASHFILAARSNFASWANDPRFLCCLPVLVFTILLLFFLCGFDVARGTSKHPCVPDMASTHGCGCHGPRAMCLLSRMW